MAEQLTEPRKQGLTTTDKLRMLLDITKKISRSLDLQEILNLVMDTLDSLIPYDAAGIFILTGASQQPVEPGDQGRVFHTEAVRGYDIDELSDLHLKQGEGIVGNVALTGQSRISPDVREDPLYINAREKTRSEMVAPIIRLMSSCKDTSTRLPPASLTNNWISSIGATV